MNRYPIYPTIAALSRTSLALYLSGTWNRPVLHARLWLAGLRHWARVASLCTHTGLGNLSQVIADDPRLLGILVWPLVDARWDVDKRLREFRRHHREVAVIGNLLDIKPGAIKTLLPLDQVHPNCAICLERQTWFDREGQLVLSLFEGGERQYSVVFILSHCAGQRLAYIGAVQGVKQQPGSDTYKELTKAAFGMRPRDLVITMFLLLCKSMQVNLVLAVRDKNRQHHHPYFGSLAHETGSANYDAYWDEHGAELASSDFYVMQPGIHAKDQADIPSKKRAMYRRRYAFLEECQQSFNHLVQTSVRSPDQHGDARRSPASP